MNIKSRLFWQIPCGLALLLVWYFKLIPLFYYWVETGSDEHVAEWRDKGIWLPAYTATIQGLAIEGIDENLSGLTFNPLTGTLFAVTNSPRYVAELSREGELLRLLPIIGAYDTEAITHVRDDLFIIADEVDNQLYWVRINDATESIVIDEFTVRLALGGNIFQNTGFEGASWDHSMHTLFVAKEKLPMRILELLGFNNYYSDFHSENFSDIATSYRVNEWKSPWSQSLFLSDLSSLSLHEASGSLLVLSHESAMAVEYDQTGDVVSIMPLWRGRHGLLRRIPQAEGITMDDHGNIFIVSEPNLFYAFERDSVPLWLAAFDNSADRNY